MGHEWVVVARWVGEVPAKVDYEVTYMMEAELRQGTNDVHLYTKPRLPGYHWLHVGSRYDGVTGPKTAAKYLAKRYPRANWRAR